MANNKLNQNENILVLVDQQNIVHIDPNTVVSPDGILEPRLVDHENLVMYVNLEADLVPRTVLYSESDRNTITSVASGSFNLLRNQNNNGYYDNYFDTNWTETFVSSNNIGLNRTTGDQTKYDPTAQTFGIENISIVVKGINNVPQVTINFVDVRGKTLFDSPDNSPYKAFFHQPWPIFYLTVKGFYGKAVRYRLQLVDFKSKFNGNTGNFEITTKFTGSSYAFLNDILLQNIVNAPYMYMVETTEPYKLNPKTNLIEKKVSKTSKGYSILKSVYDEYKNKGYIPKDFPVKTLRDLMMTASGLEAIIEKSLFSETVEPEVLSDVAQYDKSLDEFEKKIIGWGVTYLNANDPVKTETIKSNNVDKTVTFHNLNKPTSDSSKTMTGPVNLEIVTGTTNEKSFITIVNKYITTLEGNKAFGIKQQGKLKIKTDPISLESLKNITEFYVKDPNGKIGVSTEKFISRLKDIQAIFIKKRDLVERTVEEQMNTIIEDGKSGFGFKPTIRNIFAVILTNADTYIRLMKDVHNTAIRRSNIRKEEMSNYGGNKDELIYAWPEIKKNGKDGKPTFFYPNDSEITGLTKGNDYKIWPEVEFVESYNSVAVKRVDSGTAKEISPSDLTFVFDGNNEIESTYNVSTALNIPGVPPYSNKTISNILYEIHERAQTITSFDTFEYGDALDEIVKAEFNNISGATINDIDIKSLLSNKVKSRAELVNALFDFSPRERYPYYQDNASTVDYIKGILEQDFLIEPFSKDSPAKGTIGVDYTKLQAAIDSYKMPNYRLQEFPFNSPLYEKYNGALGQKDYEYKNVLKVNGNDNFISSPVNAKAWVYDENQKNLFTRKIKYGNLSRNLLNTPYFHKQLFSDFFKGGVENRYVGSAYILLNSLPYKDLDDILDFGDGKIRMSSMLKEIGATHYIPNHLILKWGGIYHRYKKYLTDGIDILSGVTTPIDGSIFFDNNRNAAFNLSGNTSTSTLTGVTYNSGLYVGIYPYYHGIYSQIVNGYSFYNPSGLTKTTSDMFGGVLDTALAAFDYGKTVTSGITKFVVSKPIATSGNTFTCLVDNSKFNVNDNRYTILPSYNGSDVVDLTNRFSVLTQDSFRIIYDNDNLNNSPQYSNAAFPNYGEKFENIAGDYSLNGVKKQVFDLIAVFSPEMLDEFEKMFLDFASLDLDLDTSISGATKYDSFQKLLKEITSVNRDGIDFGASGTELKIVENQTKKLEQVTLELLSDVNLMRVTIGNPRQIDNYILSGYLGQSKTYNVNEYDPSQLTSANQKLIELYIGQNITGQTYNNISTNLYQHFFQISNIEVSPENIYLHRELARIYAGWVKSKANGTTFVPTYADFKQYLNTEIYNPQLARYNNFLDNLLRRFPSLETSNNDNNKITIYHGQNETKTTLLDTYLFFKSFNDKWIAGNAIGQRNLMDEFLFLDRANKDIGDEAYISLDRLISLSDEKNIKIDLYSAISLLMQGTNFDVRPLPSYINFYGTNSTNKKRILPSKNLARTLFGTHLDVDYEESSPKIILQYVNKTSQYLDMERVSKDYKFKNDSFDIKDPNNNPLLIEPKIFMDVDLSKSNRVVSFEINFGDQAQNIFKNISLDQSTYKNTTESALAQERLARAQGGGGSHSVDIGLFDIYKTASYQCTVSCMGNAMIQPTMYFYLANVPMFAGTYLVFDVNHQIKPGGFETSFTGVRISNSALPSLDSTFMSSYRPLFSRILSSAVKKKQELNPGTTTTQTITTKDNKSFTVNPGTPVAGEDLKNMLVNESGFLFGDLIPYNGQVINGKPEEFIQLITHENRQWLRTRVCTMGSGKYTPTNNGKSADLSMVSGWKAYPNKLVKLEDINDISQFYSIRANITNNNRETLFRYNTTFYNPGTKDKLTLPTDVNPNAGLFDGPVHNGPNITDATYGKYGVALCSQLMRKLKLAEGDVIYICFDKR